MSTNSTKPPESTPKTRAVDLAIEQIQKQFGKGAIMKLGEGPKSTVDAISTGILPLDIALGVGGIPRGRIIEIYGPEASGKTTITLSAVAQVQKQGGIAAFIDAEHAVDPAWAEILGVDLDNLLISQPDTGEQGLEITETLVRSGGVDLIVVDSVAALVPRNEIEGNMGDSQMGLQARLMSQALRKLTAIVSKSKTTIIFTNQLRMKIGVMFGNPETTSGGMAMKFYASVRMDVRKIQTLKKGDEVIGARVRVKVVKNKVAPPFKKAEFSINSEGVDNLGSLIDIAAEQNILEKSGAFYKYKGEVVGQGVEQAKMALKENNKLTEEIKKKAYDALGVKISGGTKTPVLQNDKSTDKSKSTK
ncbi:recombinase RecA [Candidatus Roizmanbacteria bacterium CG11_big_fil_rev_8_21_14_0_20_36_8]|uniref:Protein RecA n=2 Tax=Candidatus Roizmaniibacteriota TaxID=1752723 RepID=A0A2M6IT04_9BACT|nr:MAG: recombinase RecA [Candidatus Roizmanbacteria bacterium CG11_big_fil_rev_8_21_14_0_20_36_8]PIZ64683.1 MAG: recombinase RecA [Candidatus Roizmanbacteria bacterium CG_4_10_14_0_2_um_filter_36_9]